MVSKWLVKKIGFQKLRDLLKSGEQKKVSETYYAEAAVRRCSSKQVSLKILQYSQQNTVLESLFDKAANLKGCNLIKKRLQHMCFPLSSFLYRTSLMVASDHQTINDQARKGKKNIKKKRFYSCINIYLLLLAQTRNQKGEGGGLPCPFLKIGKKCPNLEKKCPDSGHLQVKSVF